MTTLKRIFLFLVGFCLALFLGSTASAQLEIDITKGNLDPTPIAVPDFIADSSAERDFGKKIAEVIRADLERSGLFRSLDPASFLETQTNIDYKPAFADWRVIKADALVSGRIRQESPSRILVEFRLWDIFAGEQLKGVRFATTPENWRRTAHKASDAIYEALTGETGYFDTRIVFIDERGPKINKQKRLAIMDQDGENPIYLLGGSDLVLTPRFSPSSQTITYMSYENDRPQVYLLDIETGRRELLGDFPGMTFAPQFSPNGDRLIMSMERRGNSDIYVMDLKSRSTQRLTTDPAIDVSGSFSPDGRKVVFNSDRGNSPQLYVMDADGKNVKRISFGKGRYSAPVWSPRGDKIAFVRSGGGKFGIGVMDVDGKNERILTNSYLDESPTWSPNGRVIIFSRAKQDRAGTTEIWSVDLTGQNLRKVETPGMASDPAWSPLLP
ncbi:Tol-Pal system beta propeller repeat protein TolB [Litorimonas sp. WD9-15]|uniref:Tol-Pal system beta propeller repeat protein TolB n=1 Tax=Litorimonas sp. WD9-15 TaxID=3418716 RepID=UPI003CFC067A